LSPLFAHHVVASKVGNLPFRSDWQETARSERFAPVLTVARLLQESNGVTILSIL
jgi:hypothetical protein